MKPLEERRIHAPASNGQIPFGKRENFVFHQQNQPSGKRKTHTLTSNRSRLTLEKRKTSYSVAWQNKVSPQKKEKFIYKHQGEALGTMKSFTVTKEDFKNLSPLIFMSFLNWSIHLHTLGGRCSGHPKKKMERLNPWLKQAEADHNTWIALLSRGRFRPVPSFERG